MLFGKSRRYICHGSLLGLGECDKRGSSRLSVETTAVCFYVNVLLQEMESVLNLSSDDNRCMNNIMSNRECYILQSDIDKV